MAERDKILRYYKASGDGELASRLLDLAEMSCKYHKYRVTDFLDPYGWSIAETIAAHFERVKLAGYGGYRGAERIKAAFIDDDYPGIIEYNLAALKINWDSRYHRITHRDILGAVLGLGIKREIVGDIVINGSESYVVIDASILAFIVDNLSQIGSAPVSTAAFPLEKVPPREEKVKEIQTTVPSLRLDVIAAAGFSVSRSKMAADISAEKLKLNWQNVKNSSQSVKKGDIISMRGRGRVEVHEILGQTKKGRISILLKRFI